MLKYNKQAKKLPIGGDQYHEYGITFRADSFPALVDKLKDFRINNNIPVGNPEQEILMYYACAFPWMVKDDPDREEEQLSEDYVAWRQWIYDTWKTPPKVTVTEKESEFRVAACLTCPHNILLKAQSEEAKGLRARVYMLRRGMGKNHHLLGYCNHHKADVSAFVFCEPAEQFSKAVDKHAVANCWIGKKPDLLTQIKKLSTMPA